MRRRQFLAAAVVAAAAGCSSRPTASAGPAPTSPSTATAAGLTATAAAETGPEGRPGTPREILQRSTVPVLCYHQVREQTAADSAARAR
jgi:hypothetical protein